MKKIILIIASCFSIISQAQTFPVGHMSINFKDVSRTGGYSISGGITTSTVSGRDIGTEVYYPATTAGNNTSVANGQFPVVVIGHGFVMTYDNYDNIYNQLASKGYIVLLPRTEGSFSPAHAEFGSDLKYLANAGMNLNTISSPTALATFNGKVLQKSAIGGHSMGAGSSYLGAASNNSITCLFNFAAATTNPSSISSASLITVPSLVISGARDCVADTTVQNSHYTALASTKKFHVILKQLTHCDFGNGNSTNCTFGQGTSGCGNQVSNSLAFPRYMNYLQNFLDNQLKNDCSAGQRFMDSIQSNSSLIAGRKITGTIASPFNISITGVGSVCNGNTVTLTANGATSYTWTNGITNGVAFTPTISQTYSVTATNSVGCTKTVTTSITVNSNPTITATASSSLLCKGNTATLTASGATSYTWTSGPTASIYAVTPTVTTSYTVTGSNASGCTNSTVKTITVNNLPTVTALASNSVICNGNATTLSGAGATTYTWTNGVTNGVAFSPSTTATYTVTGTDANGCKNSATKTITVNNLPNVTASVSNSVVCNGSSTTLSGAGATTYTWTNGVTNGVAFSPSTTTTYTVSGTDANGCINSTTKTVTVNPLPNVTIGSSTTTLCSGQSATLTSSGATNYTWTSGPSNSIYIVTPSVTSTYSVIGVSSNGCSNSATKTITVNALPVITASASNSIVCNGGSTILSGSGATSYTWSNGVTNGVAFTPSATNTYTVIGTDMNGCENSATKIITVNALPTITTVSNYSTLCTGQSATLTATGAINYTWTSGANNANYVVTPSVTTTYTVIGEDINGCLNSSSITQSVSVCTGINNLITNQVIQIYPNPTDGNLTVSYQSFSESMIKFVIYDVSGKVVYLENEMPNNININKELEIKNLTQGLYILYIEQKDFKKSYKFIKN